MLRTIIVVLAATSNPIGQFAYGRLPDVIRRNDHPTAIRCRERAPSATSKAS